MSVPIGDARPAGQEGPAGDQRPAGSDAPAGDPRAAGEDTLGAVQQSSFDPAAHTVDEVKAHLDEVDTDERERVLTAERDGKDRTSITG